MHPSIFYKHDEIVAACCRYAVRWLEIFGSAARGDDFDPIESDVDLLVASRHIPRSTIIWT